jgi:hypothetical protein
MSFSDEQIMLTLAGLTYRGFQDGLSGEPHAGIVCREILDGLRTLSPIRNSWELVWGPVTSRGPRAVFSTSTWMRISKSSSSSAKASTRSPSSFERPAIHGIPFAGRRARSVHSVQGLGGPSRTHGV